MVLYTPGSTSSYDQTPLEHDEFRYHFLGGGEEVGNVGCILEDSTNTRILIDYGFVPTNPPNFPEESPPVSDVILTHSHIDHIGLAPWLVSSHGANLHCTKMTADLLEMIWRDTYKVSSIEGQPLPWDKRDLEEALDHVIIHPYNSLFEIGEWELRFLPSGHIPGAAMVEINTPQKNILWSGDFDSRDSGIVSGAKPVSADLFFMESTYGGREQPVREDEIQRFINRVVSVVERGGTCLVPCFANGRGQDILTYLWDSKLDLEVHFDGMGKKILSYYLDNSEYIKDIDKLKKIKRWSRLVSSKSDRKKALDADVIVTTSGMLDGGPAHWYLNRLRHDQRNAILLTGYQAENSGGRRLIEESRLEIFGKIVDINLEVDQYSFSSHADHSRLVQFSKDVNPSDVILFHGNRDEYQDKLKIDLEKEGIKVHQPQNRKSYLL